MKKVLIILSSIGFIDAIYVTYEYFSKRIPFCLNTPFIDCGKVLHSEYMNINGIPISFLGVIYYLILLILSIAYFKNKQVLHILSYVSVGGFLMALYVLVIQIFVIRAICIYCFISAVTNITLFHIINSLRRKSDRKKAQHIIWKTIGNY